MCVSLCSLTNMNDSKYLRWCLWWYLFIHSSQSLCNVQLTSYVAQYDFGVHVSWHQLNRYRVVNSTVALACISCYVVSPLSSQPWTRHTQTLPTSKVILNGFWVQDFSSAFDWSTHTCCMYSKTICLTKRLEVLLDAIKLLFLLHA